MKSPKDLLGQSVGRGGRPAIVDMTVEQVQEIDPGFCNRLQAVSLSDPALCGTYLHRTVGELLQADHVGVATLLQAVEAQPIRTHGNAATSRK